MKAFESQTGLIATLRRANIDTDQIIPKQFLKSIKKTGFEKGLFYDWRYKADGLDNPDFELNRPKFTGATILVTGTNFGCGSSREHAVWALHQYGFQVIIAPRRETGGTSMPAFADIFRSNCSKNGLLTVELSEAEVETIFQYVDRFNGLEATIDLDEQRVVLRLDEEVSFHFEIDPDVKSKLTHGLDDIALTLQHEEVLSNFEQKHNPQIPTAGKGWRAKP